ncbi:MAG: nucleoside triphosphate pyrophosphohydrolase [Pseudomonadales bacterium]|nr:nucleoside triphosphate pyrophosphohydrolase [Pseudomonadales bacterium]
MADKQVDSGRDFEARSDIEKLLAIMAMLRDGESGCPWDLEQSIASLVPYTLEEVYEVVDAIEKQDMVDLEDELGDLLFQVVFYAQIASEDGHFNFADIARAITRKLIRRHPHVFPGGEVTNFGSKPELSSDQVVTNWEAIKKQEREEKQARRGSVAANEQASSVLNDVPRALPAMERAKKLQSRAASHGFDWTEIPPVLAKLKEEIGELEEALQSGDKAHLQHELGDVFFAAINLSRHCGLEPELALRQANNRFETRFHWIEAALESQGRKLDDTPLDELDALWDAAKRQEQN